MPGLCNSKYYKILVLSIYLLHLSAFRFYWSNYLLSKCILIFEVAFKLKIILMYNLNKLNRRLKCIENKYLKSCR